MYKAAVAEKYENEGAALGFEPFVIPKGTYLTVTVNNWQKRVADIGDAFQKLCSDSRIDRFPCVAWYRTPDDVVCMVKIRTE